MPFRSPRRIPSFATARRSGACARFSCCRRRFKRARSIAVRAPDDRPQATGPAVPVARRRCCIQGILPCVRDNRETLLSRSGLGGFGRRPAFAKAARYGFSPVPGLIWPAHSNRGQKMNERSCDLERNGTVLPRGSVPGRLQRTLLLVSALSLLTLSTV